VYCCWLLVGQRFLVGMGSGRKRLNILGAYCPDDQEYVDLRLTRGLDHPLALLPAPAGFGGDPGRALWLAQHNLSLRQTPRARALVRRSSGHPPG